MTEHTVKAHIHQIFNKLGVHSRTQIAIFMQRSFIKQIALGVITNPIEAANEFLNGTSHE